MSNLQIIYSCKNTKAQATKPKPKRQMDYIKLKKLLHSKGTIKRQLTEWEKTYANHVSINKGLILKMYEELL